MLMSQLFKDDARCAACAKVNASHIVPGDAGPHVTRIHCALMVLDGFHPAIKELRERRYGETTAAGVLAFKRRRHIINFTYQTKEDQIVGIMTIAAMDREMWQRELQAPVTGRRLGGVR